MGILFPIWKGMVFMTKIYAPLKRYFLSLFFTLVLSLIPYIIFDNKLNIAISVISIIFTIIQIHAIYCMRPACGRIDKSFRYFIISLIGMIITLIITVAAIFVSIGLALLSAIVMLVFACISIVANYQFIWGLDELVTKNSYSYPNGKIRFMFWLTIINGLITGSLANSGAAIQALIVGTVCSICSLWLLYEYLQAVHERESKEL